MRKGKVLALILSCAMLFTMTPFVEGYGIDLQNNQISNAATGAVVFAASKNWQPKPNKTVSNASSFPITLKNGDVLQINGPINYSAATGKSPITIASGADVKIIINGSVTLHGANASGKTGATAAINVPEGAKLTIYSAHDEELSTSKSAPKDSLTVTGGNAAAGTDGTAGEKRITEDATIQQKTTNWVTGNGGNGGGGAAAAIGGNGGSGGSGALGGKSPQYIVERTWSGRDFYDFDDRRGADGKAGSSGSSAAGAGIIYISGRLTLSASGGSAAAGGSGKSGSGGYAFIKGLDRMIGGAGGGGGGGGGCSAQAIGAGGAGGSGGGSGGHPGSDQKDNVQGPGGGGGGGGWPNGGGGGGGGAECTKAEDKYDNTSQGGVGGVGGGAGGSGRSGSSGTQTGTDHHGKDDAKPGAGGAGGSGVQGGAGGGGAGGKEKDDKNYNGGSGGSGGGAVSLKAWHNTGCLIISTASNFSSYSYGDGGGKGTTTSLTPYVIYDLMDCKVNLSSTAYTYSGSQFRPAVASVTYSSATDRDRKQTPGSGSTLNSSRYSVSYGENIHCPSGTVSVSGNQDSSRTATTINGAVIGSTDVTFTINKAKLTAPITLSTSTPYINQTVTATLNNYTSATAGSGKLANLLRSSTKKAEGPVVTWSLQSSTAGKITQINGLQAKFLLTGNNSTNVQVRLSDMNDFEDCTTTYSVTPKSPQTWTTSLSADTPHPRIPISVVLPSRISSATYQWYSGGVKLDGATDISYTPTADDIGKTLSVKVTPSADSGYAELTVTSKNAVESHKYSSNGFCSVCDEYQPAALSGNVYQITNGGQMFWFAALVNGDTSHAVFSEKNPAASGVLTKSVDLESREWKPIGNSSNSFTGDFNGQGNTISKFSVTKTNSYTGLFGYVSGNIREFTVEGNITLSAAGRRIGGVVGSLYGGTVYGVYSKVNINDSGYKSNHIGGIVGGVDNPESTIEKCLFEGNMRIAASTDCIGGILGYSNAGAHIRNCANLGVITTSAQGAYTGGILGYVNNSSPSIQNCYNYGSVQNIGGGNYCGAIVGRMSNHTPSKYTDNYYLDTSAPAAFGTGSDKTSAKAYAKDSLAFASGEVCYLINGSSSADDVVWRQDVDNGNTPYDNYPVFDGGIVLRNRSHHDCTTGSYVYAYSNSAASEDHINHNYVNGFCSCCDELEPAVQANGVYIISNGGQFFWFANQLNSGAIPQSSKAELYADIDLEGGKNGQPAGYDSIIKDRNFPGVGTPTNNYSGTFSGNGHTVSDLYISRENKTETTLQGVGLFGYTKGATISKMTVYGDVTVHRETEKGKIERIGGIVGAVDGGKISELFSYVNITGIGELETPHVGGVAGEATNTSDVFKCMYFGTIDFENTQDCIGGIVGYINTAEVRYCANHGTLKTGHRNGFIGGVLGYLNNSGGSVHNCYNYGTVQNGGGRYSAAIIGMLRSHTASKITDNYCLIGSAAAAFDTDVTNGTKNVSAPFKDKATFESGEVCYLVNSKTSTGDKAVFKQNIDNGITPYDKYPVFDSEAVYFRSDNTYSNEPEKISLTISWGAMEFEYHSGLWNPDTHSYSGGWSPTNSNGDNISVQNDSNVALNAEFSFTPDQTLEASYNLTGSFDGISGDVNRVNRNASLSSRLVLRSLAPDTIKDGGKKKLGDITVRLTTIGGGN